MTTVYLAGGIAGLSDEQAKGWRSRAQDLLPSGVIALDPMSRDYRGIEDGNAEEIVHGDLRDIAQSHAVIANCVRPSWGTAMEIYHAHTLGKTVVGIVPEGDFVSPWLAYHTHAIVRTVEEAVEQIVEWFQ